MLTPTDLHYSDTHEWVRSAGDDVVTIGITDFAQHELGDVVYLELPEPGRAIAHGDPFGTVESVKAVSDLVAPVSGEVVEVNSALVDAPDVINQDPYASWFVSVRLSNTAELDALMSAEKYEAFTNTD